MRTPEEIKMGLKSCSDMTQGQDCRNCKYRKGVATCIEELMADALTYIGYLEEHVEAYMQGEQKWISVKEKLPCGDGYDDGESFLTRYKYKRDTNEKRYAVLEWHADRKQFEMEGFCGLRVTHWMPIPNLPEE